MTARNGWGDVDRVFEYGIDVPSRTLFLTGEVDGEQAAQFLKGMHLLTGGDVNIIMDNTGGDEYHGLAIYDAIATCEEHVTVTVFGHAMSMGSIILQAADDRVLAPNATLMMHYGTWGTGEEEVTFHRVRAKEMERVNALMETAYLERMKAADPRFSLRKLKRMLNGEIYMAPTQAVELGLADRILE